MTMQEKFIEKIQDVCEQYKKKTFITYRYCPLKLKVPMKYIPKEKDCLIFSAEKENMF